MAEPQAILVPFTEAAIFLVLTVERGHEDEVRDVLADVERASPLGRLPLPGGAS